MQRSLNLRSRHLMFGALLLLIAVALFGCGSGDDGATGPQGPPGPRGADLTAGTVDASTFTFDDLRNIPLGGKIISASTAGDKPTVTFQVVNKATNQGIRGLRTFALHIAQLKPEADGANSYWQNYILTGTNPRPGADPVTTFKTDGTVNVQGYSVVDNGDGTYVVTFGKDIKTVASVPYDATLVHRVVVGVRSVAVPGVVGLTPGAYAGPINPLTGAVFAQFTNTNGVNLTYDFIPSTGAMVADSTGKQAFARDIVSIDGCNECHYKLQYGSNNTSGHFGSRTDTKTCVMCHTPQNFVAGQEATTNADFTPFIHKIHMGKELPKAETSSLVQFEATYPQDIKNCAKCHRGTDKDNWKTKPTRKACGSCHNNVNFATGANHLGGAKADDKACTLCHTATDIVGFHVTVDPTGSSTRGGYPVNTADNVPTPGFPSGQGPAIPLASQLGNLPDGVYKMNFEIKQVTVGGAAGAKKATVVYRILKDGQPVTFNATGFLIPNVDGTPSIYVDYAVAQDGISEPADWTNNFNASVKQIRDGANGNSQTGPDSSGYYTATLATIIPDAAKLVTAAIGINYQGFVQLNHPKYPNGIRLREPQFVMKTADGYKARRTIVSNAKCNNCHGQLGVSPSFHSGARNNGEGCAMCHNYSISNATGHIGAAYFYGGGWSISAKDLIHGIHGSAKRTQAYSYEATADNPGGFKEVTYPGILKNCEQCHNPGMYDFTATVTQSGTGTGNAAYYTDAVMNSLLWSTAAKGDMTIPAGYTGPVIGLSPWVPKPAGNYTGRDKNLVISPISAACFGCHDSNNAVGHMRSNGGVIYGTITATNNETCMVCHGPANNAAFNETVPTIKAVHRWW